MSRAILSIIALTCSVLSVQAYNYNRQYGYHKIVGGQDAVYAQFPYQLFLITSHSTCGASIISVHWALSAGHCLIFQKPRNVFVYAGALRLSERSMRHSVDIVWVHQQYNGRNSDYDIGVLRVVEPFDLSNPAVAIIPLARKNSVITTGTNAIVSGWGRTREGGAGSNTLKWVQIQTMPQDDCRTNYSRVGMEVTDRMFCAGKYNTWEDSCQGDSGGPIVQNGVQIGIVSWGLGCARPGLPGVYTYIGYSDISDMITYVTGVH